MGFRVLVTCRPDEMFDFFPTGLLRYECIERRREFDSREAARRVERAFAAESDRRLVGGRGA